MANLEPQIGERHIYIKVSTEHFAEYVGDSNFFFGIPRSPERQYRIACRVAKRMDKKQAKRDRRETFIAAQTRP